MPSVFYDLETSDKHAIGQILNYSFISQGFTEPALRELSGLVRLSRLQIPEPGAILANRTDIIEHQKIATHTEPEALKRIASFIAACIEASRGAIALIGYNSARFDLNYLRTSFIRNGINPYFSGAVVSRDLLHVVQKAYLTSPEFRQKVLEQRRGEKKLSLSLQTVGHALGLLAGEQAHESREDVLLTIRVAEWLFKQCGLDVATFEAYEGGRLHSTARTGAVYFEERPEYDLSAEGHSIKTPLTLLDASPKAALWIDLDRYAYKQSPECISWRSAAKHSFFVSDQAAQDPELQKLARMALKQFSGVTLKNFFGETSCDIELDIYRLDFDSLDLYIRAIRDNNKSLLEGCSSSDARVLWLRRQLASPSASIDDPKTAEILRKYALHRYGGKLQIAKSLERRSGDEEQDGAYHSTLGVLVRDLDQKREAAALTGNQADLALLNSLAAYIRGSDIVKVAGAELIPGWLQSSLKS